MAEHKKTAGVKAGLKISDERVFESIRQRAYELFCKRGSMHGSDMNDWLEAEKQVKKELGLRG